MKTITKTTMSLAAAMGTLALAATSANAATIDISDPLVPAGVGVGDTFRLFFVSSTTLADGNYSNDISAYDALVQGAANATTNLGGFSWFAVGESVNDGNLGTGNGAFAAGSTDVGIFFVNNAKLADNIAGLGSVAPNVTETGGTYNGIVATGQNDVGYYTGTVNTNYRLGPTAPSTQTGAGHSDGTTNWFVGGEYLGTPAGNIDDGAQAHFYAISEDLTVSGVPEPSSAALLGLGGLALIFRRRK